MAERYDLPKIKPDEKPSIVNYDAGLGAFWGNLGGFAAGLVAPAKYRFGIIIAGTALGAAIGGMNGKKAQENDVATGKVVKTPGYWNKGIIAGMMSGWAIATPLKYLLKDSLAGKTALTISAIGEFGGAIIGSIMRKNSLQRDFDKAVAIRDANHAKTQQLLEAAIANQNNPPLREEEAVASFKNSVTPDESALLMEKQAQAAAPVTTKPEHGPEHKPQPDHTAHGDAHAPEHHAAHGEHHSEHHGEHHDAPSHAAKHEHQQHTGSHAAKHEPAASHTDHAQKHDTGMAMSA